MCEYETQSPNYARTLELIWIQLKATTTTTMLMQPHRTSCDHQYKVLAGVNPQLIIIIILFKLI